MNARNSRDNLYIIYIFIFMFQRSKYIKGKYRIGKYIKFY